MKNVQAIFDASEMPECRMFTNMQETLIFSAAGKLSAIMAKIRQSGVNQVDMTARVPLHLLSDAHIEIDALKHVCMDALGNKEIVE